MRKRSNKRPRAGSASCAEALGHLVVDRVGGLLRRARRDAEDPGQLGLEPEAHRRAPEQVPAFAQQPPRRPRRGFGERARPDPEGVEPDPVGVQQPGHVVVGRHEQRRRVGERLIVAAAAADRRGRAARSPAGRATASYSRRAIARSPGSAGSSRSGCRHRSRDWHSHKPNRTGGSVLRQRHPGVPGAPAECGCRHGQTAGPAATGVAQIGGAERRPHRARDPGVRARPARRRAPRRAQRLRAGAGRHPQLPAAAAGIGDPRRAARARQPPHGARRARHPRRDERAGPWRRTSATTPASWPTAIRR